MALELVALDRDRHDRARFRCGAPSLDRYLSQQASQDIRRQLCAVYVLADDATGRIHGYYTLSASSIMRDDLPAQSVQRLPHYDSYPAALIGRLAVDQAFQGERLGEVLLFDALKRSSDLASRLGIHAVVVDALDERAAGYYRKFGFHSFTDNERRLFLTIAATRHLLPSTVS